MASRAQALGASVSWQLGGELQDMTGTSDITGDLEEALLKRSCNSFTVRAHVHACMHACVHEAALHGERRISKRRVAQPAPSQHHRELPDGV